MAHCVCVWTQSGCVQLGSAAFFPPVKQSSDDWAVAWKKHPPLCKPQPWLSWRCVFSSYSSFVFICFAAGSCCESLGLCSWNGSEPLSSSITLNLAFEPIWFTLQSPTDLKGFQWRELAKLTSAVRCKNAWFSGANYRLSNVLECWFQQGVFCGRGRPGRVLQPRGQASGGVPC